MSEKLTTVKLDPRDFKAFSWVCAGLPNVKPRTNQQALRDLLQSMGLHDRDEVSFGTSTVSRIELRELFRSDSSGYYTVERVSPSGAKLLVRLYREQQLAMSRKTFGEVSAEVLEYCDSEPALLAQAQARADEKAAYSARLNDLASFAESEFSYTLLDDIFWRHKGEGSHTLDIGGIKVGKSVSRFRSNSGKSTDFRVRFYWTGADGQPHELVKPSTYEDNRRNDDERNWGLPE